MAEHETQTEFTVLYSYISRKLAGPGITKAEIEEIKGHPIGHQSVEGFININLSVGNFQWRGDRLVNADRKFILGLTRQEEDKLRLLAEKNGVSEVDFVNQELVKILTNS
jgi:hypothetical protein